MDTLNCVGGVMVSLFVAGAAHRSLSSHTKRVQNWYFNSKDSPGVRAEN